MDFALFVLLLSLFAELERAESYKNRVWIMLIKLLRYHNPCFLTLYTGGSVGKETVLREFAQEN
jgi:hypothetical protein